MGINFDDGRIKFSPHMPNSINSLVVRNVKIRNTTLNINIKGNGSIIKRFCANGKLVDNYIEYVDGAVKVDIEMAKPQKIGYN